MYKIIGADGKEYGPVNVEQLRQWLAAGRVNRQTSVCPEGSAGWSPMESMPELAALFLVPPPLAAPQQKSSGINTLIPYKNPKALTAYYLGIFSLIPFFGILLGIAAFVLGILGLRFRRRNPTVGGAVHAWIGIIVGGLFGFGYLALTLFIVFATTTKH